MQRPSGRQSAEETGGPAVCGSRNTVKKSMKWKGNFWRRLMSKHAVLRRRSRRRQFSLVASDFLYCVKFCDEDDISPCFLSWLTVFSCYICQIDLWSWSCTVHIRCTWPATACLRNKPTYHSHKFTSFILLNKKKKKKEKWGNKWAPGRFKRHESGSTVYMHCVRAVWRSSFTCISILFVHVCAHAAQSWTLCLIACWVHATFGTTLVCCSHSTSVWWEVWIHFIQSNMALSPFHFSV